VHGRPDPCDYADHNNGQARTGSLREDA